MSRRPYDKFYPLNRKEFTRAVQRYARRHGHYAGTVRTMTKLRQAAVLEFIHAQADGTEK